jgi:hypothetical protein
MMGISDATFSIVTGYVQLLGLPALIGGISSAFIYQWLTGRGLKKKSRTESLYQKLGLYSYLIFQLDRMRFEYEALENSQNTPLNQRGGMEGFSASEKELNKIFEGVIAKIEDKYHLFKQEFLKEWMSLITLPYDKSSAEKTPILRKMLIEEYNENILPEYEKLTEIKLESRA